MQSFFTILIAAVAAFTAIFLLNPEQQPETATLTSADIPELTLPDTGLPSFLLNVQEPLVLALDVAQGLDLSTELAADGVAVLRD